MFLVQNNHLDVPKTLSCRYKALPCLPSFASKAYKTRAVFCEEIIRRVVAEHQFLFAITHFSLPLLLIIRE